MPGDAGCPIHAWLAPVTVAHSTTVPRSHGCQTWRCRAGLEESDVVVGVDGHAVLRRDRLQAVDRRREVGPGERARAVPAVERDVLVLCAMDLESGHRMGHGTAVHEEVARLDPDRHDLARELAREPLGEDGPVGVTGDEDSALVDVVLTFEFRDQGRDEPDVVDVVLILCGDRAAAATVPDEPVGGDAPDRCPVRIDHNERVRLGQAVEAAVLLELAARTKTAVKGDQQGHGRPLGQRPWHVELVRPHRAPCNDDGAEASRPPGGDGWLGRRAVRHDRADRGRDR